MAIVTYLRRFNGGTVNYVYRVKNMDNFQLKFRSPISPMPLPEEDDDQQILVKVEGNSTTVSKSWVLKPETSNLGSNHNGASAPGSTKTIWEQLLFWEDFMIGTGISSGFDMVIADDAVVTGLGNLIPDNILYQKAGFITDFNINTNGSEPNSFRASITLIVGNSITSYNTNTPSEVNNFNATTGTLAGEIDVVWTDPSSDGGSAVTGHVILYKKGTQQWEDATASAVANSVTITGATPGSEYKIRMYAENVNGAGRSSPIREVTAKA